MPNFETSESKRVEQKEKIEKVLPLWALKSLLLKLEQDVEATDTNLGKTHLRISQFQSEAPFSDSVNRFTSADIEELYKVWEIIQDKKGPDRDKLEQEIYDKTRYIRTTEREGGRDFPALASTRFLLNTLGIYHVPEPKKNN